MGNRSRDSQGVQGHRSAPSKGGPERKPGAQGYRSPNVGKARPTKVGAKPDKKDDEADEGSDKANEVKKTDEEESKREDGEDGEEKKRDWKDEKKPEEGEIVDDEKDGEKRGKGAASRYSGIPNGLFFCHVCKKHMWDDHSFENHLKGRTHLLMMEKLEESYKIKVDLMRHELQVAEQQREIELERMKRQGKKIQMSSREYCTMCDLSFYGNIVMHRKTERHQQLKSFLHPRCLPCGKEFPTRVEWDIHKLTAVHLRKTAEARKNRKAGSDDEFGIEDFIASDNGERRDIKVRTREDEENDIIEMDKNKEKGSKDDDNKDKEDGKLDDAKGVPVVDPSGNLRYRVPKYNPDVAVGQSLLKKVTGQTCRACHRFFLHEEDAKTHCRTLSHYNNYIELVKTKARVMSQERREAKKNDDGTDKGKRPMDVDDEGNWKRRKVANANDEDEDGTEESRANATDKTSEGATVPGVNAKEEPTSTSTTDAKLDPGQEKYDPLEADNDDSLAGDDKVKTEKTSETEGKKKIGDIVDDDNLWEEVDRDIGNILETVQGEDGEAPAGGGEDDESKADKGEEEEEEEEEEESSKPATRTRGSTGGNRGAAPSPRGGRGRKKK